MHALYMLLYTLLLPRSSLPCGAYRLHHLYYCELVLLHVGIAKDCMHARMTYILHVRTTMCIMYNFIYGADINNKRLKDPGGQ